MELYEVIWKTRFVEKLATKHGVDTDEVEQVLFGKPHVRHQERGQVPGEKFYVAYGQTESGRYLIVFFVLKDHSSAMPISAGI